MTTDLRPGDRVTLPPGDMPGTIVRQLGRHRAGSGVRYRVEWDNGATSVENPVYLKKSRIRG